MSHLIMGSGRRNEKGKAPAYSNPVIEATNGGVTFPEGKLGEDVLDSFLDMPISIAGWEDEEIHQSAAHGVPEPIGNPRFDSLNRTSFRDLETNLRFNTADTNLQEFPLLPDWGIGWGQHDMTLGHNAMSAGDVSAFGGPSFGTYNRPQQNTDIVSSSSLFSSRDTPPVHARNSVSFDTNQSAVRGKYEGSFLSLGLGATSETVSNSQLVRREIPDKGKDVASNELRIARAQKATGQTFSHVNRMPTTNSEFGSHGSLNSSPGSSAHHILQMQQNIRQHGRSDKLRKAASDELKMVQARKAAGQALDTGFMGFQTNNSGFSRQYSNVDRITPANYGVGLHRTSHGGSGSSSHHIPQMQQADSRMIRSGDLDHYKALIGNRSMHSGPLGGNSVKIFNSQQHNAKPSEFHKPSWTASYPTPPEQSQYVRSSTSNSLNYAGMQGHVVSQNGMHTKALGGNLFAQRTAVPQVSWLGSGLDGTDAPFPKRLGIEYDARNGTQIAHRHLSPVGTSLQTTNTASSVDSQSQKFDTHVRRRHKRTAVAPPESASHWAHRHKVVHPSIPAGSWAQPTGHVAGPSAAHIHPAKPWTSNVKSHVPVPTAPAVSHIKWKDPDATPKLSGSTCFVCKTDLALHSEWSSYLSQVPSRIPVAVLPCGHAFHDECLQKITPDDQAKDPPCIPCAIAEK